MKTFQKWAILKFRQIHMGIVALMKSGADYDVSIEKTYLQLLSARTQICDEHILFMFEMKVSSNLEVLPATTKQLSDSRQMGLQQRLLGDSLT